MFLSFPLSLLHIINNTIKKGLTWRKLQFSFISMQFLCFLLIPSFLLIYYAHKPLLQCCFHDKWWLNKKMYLVDSVQQPYPTQPQTKNICNNCEECTTIVAHLTHILWWALNTLKEWWLFIDYKLIVANK